MKSEAISRRSDTHQRRNDKESKPEESDGATSLWLIRHAEVEAAYQNVFGGRIDMNLSPRGEEQARALGAYLNGRHFDAIYTSPMRRVQQTLDRMLHPGLPKPEVVQELREVDFGDWTGLSWAAVQTKFAVSPFAWLDQLECAGIPNAECGATLRARIEPCVTGILTKHQGGRVAVLCHGGVIRVVLSTLLDLPLPTMSVVEVDYASITQLAWAPGRPRLELVNFTPWRDLPQ